MLSILPHELPQALDRAPASCRILSLDCFDTLLWRTTHAPTGVFADIGAPGGTVQQRRWAESHARSHAALHRRSNEARIAEIYEMLLPNAADAVRAAGVAAELAAEARHCFAFAPTVELMREAKRRGMKVIVVSDTYLSGEQLGRLIAEAAGGEVRDLIDRIFCSSEHGVSKAEGLFKPVLKQLGVRADTILHVGDNIAADGRAPCQLGIHGCHLVQFAAATQQRLRLEAAVGAVLQGGGRALAGYQLHRAGVAWGEPQIEDDAVRLGYSVLGPVLSVFDGWLREEAAAIARETAGKVHLLFLMRDGHLPYEVYAAGAAIEGVAASRVEISRFTATAAGFTSQAVVERFLERELGTEDLKGIARQLLFDARETAALMGPPAPGVTRMAHFLTNLRQRKNIAKILERSSAFRARMLRHVRAATGCAAGDTLMLVDLGYAGTVQDRIDEVLRQGLGVQVAGRYLLLREHDVSGHDKRGLLDARSFDGEALNALCSNVAPIEQLCTVSQGSVVGYTEDGAPIRAESGIKARQSEVRDRVQQGSVLFVQTAGAAMANIPASLDAASARDTAAAALARFMFLPQADELAVLRQFEHDVNLGGGEMVPLFDEDVAADALRRDGMFYVREADRMFVPAELQGQGLPFTLSLLTQRRFNLDFRRADFRGTGLTLPIIVADGHAVSVSTVEAERTHDGFFTASIPVGASRFAIGLQFGRLYEWIEVQSAMFRPARLLGDDPGPAAERTEVAANPSFEAMETVADGLIRCLDSSAFMMIPPPPPTGEALILSVVFRPIVARQPAARPTSGRAAAVAGVRA